MNRALWLDDATRAVELLLCREREPALQRPLRAGLVARNHVAAEINLGGVELAIMGCAAHLFGDAVCGKIET